MATHSQYKTASPPTIYSDNFIRDSRIGKMILKEQEILNAKLVEILDLPVNPTDGANKAYVDSVAGGGGTPSSPNNSIQFNNSGTFGGSSNLVWSGSSLDTTNINADNVAVNNPPINPTDATNKAYVDSLVSTPGGVSTNVQFNQGGAFVGSNDFVWNDFTKFLYVNGRILLPNPPLNPTDAANKAYVDSVTGSVPGGSAMNIQFNSNPAGVFSGTNDFTWDNINKIQSVNGFVVANSFVTTSDVKFKSNIQQIDNPLDILSKIDGYSYNLNNSSKRSYGVIAQDIEKINEVSDIVNDCGSFKAVDYHQFVPLLIESVKQMNEKMKSGNSNGISSSFKPFKPLVTDRPKRKSRYSKRQ